MVARSMVVSAVSIVATMAVAQEKRARDVVVFNNTAQVLEEFTLTPQVGERAVVGKLDEPLSSFASVTVKIEGGRCGFYIAGKYEDGSPVTAKRDLCKHRRLQLGTLR